MIGEREIEGRRALTISDAAGELEAAFIPDAGMVCCSLLHRGEEILGQRHGLRGYIERRSTMGIPLLYPWANRLGAERIEAAGGDIDLSGDSALIKRDGNGLPIHGLLSAAPDWRVESHAGLDAGGQLLAALEWDADSERARRFPFPHVLRFCARLIATSLMIELTVEPGEVAVPLAFGFHPYLALPGAPRREWVLELPVSEQLALDRRGLPTGERRQVSVEPAPLGERSFDDLYRAPAPYRPLVLSGGGRRVELAMDASYPYAQVYAPAEAELIALEPMTAPTDALAQGSAALAEPGTPFTAVFTLDVG